MPWALLVFGLALVSGLTMVFVVSKTSVVSAGFDPYNFGQMGKSIAAGHGFAGFGNLLERKAPLYPAAIGAVYAVFGVHPQLFLVIQCFMFAGTCLLVFAIGRRLFNEHTGVVAAVICALNPMLLNYIAYLHLETQLTLLVTLTIWLMVRFYQRPSVGNGVLIGIAAGAASLTKPVVLFHPALFAIGIVLAFRAARRRGEHKVTPWVALIAMLVAMGCTILPWTIRNYRSSGHFVLVSAGTSDAFLRGFIFSRTEFITLQKPPYTADAENESNAYFRAVAKSSRHQSGRRKMTTERTRSSTRRPSAELVHQPGQVARKTAIGLFTFWYELTTFKNSLLALVLAIAAWALALVGWRRAHREGRPSWLLWLPIIYLNVSMALLLALGRYSVPILPALLVLSAFGIDLPPGSVGPRRARSNPYLTSTN